MDTLHKQVKNSLQVDIAANAYAGQEARIGDDLGFGITPQMYIRERVNT